MKKIFTILLLGLALTLQAQTIQRIEPLCWWTDMKLPLTVMIYGTDLQDAQVSIQQKVGKKLKPTDGLVVRGQHNAESKNYLFVDLDVREAGNYLICLQKGKKVAKVEYSIENRRAGSADRKSYTSADVIYLIMSDRFVDGDPSNNSTPDTREKANKDNMDGRWGGDIQGIINSLDYIKELGATAIWPTPLTLDDEQAWSYHGYACSDYYHIDPRFGSNALYKEMVKKAHEKGLKFLMDMVPNHCGYAHWWMQDLPFHDWIHQFPTYTRTTNIFSTAYDINASDYDRNLNESGWFDTHMPDMNLDNPDLLQYFKQWAIWWIEYADLDGLRVDTYPYNEKVPASLWCKAIREEYPNMNIVGECWVRPSSEVAYWQADRKNFDGFNSNLPSVMDFPLEEAIRGALQSSNGRGRGGMGGLYSVLAQDYQYADVNKLLIFVGNHDMDHITDVVADNDLRRVKLSVAILATMRGIPQLFQGDEYGQRSADMKRGHSGLRRPLLAKEEWTAEQKDLFAYQASLLHYRQHSDILQLGKTKHFSSNDNTYCYFRYTADGAIMVFLNGSNEERTVPVSHYKEVLDIYGYKGTDIIDRSEVELQEGLTVDGLSAMIIKLHK
ncbi:MAG: cyclomaltodextrinase C-terminal domain-containing protein [Bacteroidales bacterium]|nr:cyclomaltodextrinase C-terminal domain-containing protein [Candidatus Colicola faecequi]